MNCLTLFSRLLPPFDCHLTVITVTHLTSYATLLVTLFAPFTSSLVDRVTVLRTPFRYYDRFHFKVSDFPL